MELSEHEIVLVEELHSAMRSEREPKDILKDCRSAIAALLNHFCLVDCKVKKTSPDAKNTWYYLTNRDNSFFWGENPRSFQTFNKEQLDVYKNIHYG